VTAMDDSFWHYVSKHTDQIKLEKTSAK